MPYRNLITSVSDWEVRSILTTVYTPGQRDRGNLATSIHTCEFYWGFPKFMSQDYPNPLCVCSLKPLSWSYLEKYVRTILMWSFSIQGIPQIGTFSAGVSRGGVASVGCRPDFLSKLGGGGAKNVQVSIKESLIFFWLASCSLVVVFGGSISVCMYCNGNYQTPALRSTDDDTLQSCRIPPCHQFSLYWGEEGEGLNSKPHLRSLSFLGFPFVINEAWTWWTLTCNLYTTGKVRMPL